MSKDTRFSEIQNIYKPARRRLRDRSRHVRPPRTESLILFWVFFPGVAAALRVESPPEPIRAATDLIRMVIPYGLIALAAIAGHRLARVAFPGNRLPEWFGMRPALFGRWRQLDQPVAGASCLRPLRLHGFPAGGLVAQFSNLQGRVPVARPLGKLLAGDITKALVSMLAWIPYLSASERVSVIYRSRDALD